jgi:hypothetical protein
VSCDEMEPVDQVSGSANCNARVRSDLQLAGISSSGPTTLSQSWCTLKALRGPFTTKGVVDPKP